MASGYVPAHKNRKLAKFNSNRHGKKSIGDNRAEEAKERSKKAVAKESKRESLYDKAA